MIRNVIIYGTSGVGKTTLCLALRDCLQIPFIPLNMDQPVDQAYLTWLDQNRAGLLIDADRAANLHKIPIASSQLVECYNSDDLQFRKVHAYKLANGSLAPSAVDNWKACFGRADLKFPGSLSLDLKNKLVAMNFICDILNIPTSNIYHVAKILDDGQRYYLEGIREVLKDSRPNLSE